MHLISLSSIRKTRAHLQPFEFINTTFFSFFLAVLCSACALQSYEAKPIDSKVVGVTFDQKSVNDEKFLQFLRNKGYPQEQLPLTSWDFKALVDCALFFHPSLNVARAQLNASQASKVLASRPNLPHINGNIGRSNRANGDINPFAYQLSIDIPINTQNKRQIQIESFSHLTETAKLDVAQTAWNLRQPIALTLNELKWLETKLRLANKDIALQQQVLAMLEKRKKLGLASSIEVSQATFQLHTSNAIKNQLEHNKIVAINNLAKQIGLPISVVNEMHINLASIKTHSEHPSENLQRAALLNRLDARIALERYAVAEAKVKLEIAKQYPDITLSPGYAYEFGDKVWSLGFSSLLNLLKGNQAAITEAMQLRSVEVAQFEALQAEILGQTNAANALLAQAQLQLASQQKLLKQQQALFARTQAQFNAGEIDRLTLTLAQVALLKNENELAQAEFQAIKAWFNLENMLQTPLMEDANMIQQRLSEAKN